MRSTLWISLLLEWKGLGIYASFIPYEVGSTKTCRPRRVQHAWQQQRRQKLTSKLHATLSLGDYTVTLKKPLGLILEERDDNGGGGVRVVSINEDGSSAGTRIVPGDVLVKIEDQDVSTADFDVVMEKIQSSPSPLRLTLGDGLGQLDMPKNVVRTLKTSEDAFFVDAVVREAAREIRRSQRLGDLKKVEVVVGAGVQQSAQTLKAKMSSATTGTRRAMVRFFAIFSTDTVSSYSCNVSATGIEKKNGEVKIIALSCAKDEGLGKTVDLIVEKPEQ